MEQRLHLRLQIHPHHRLGDPVRHGGHAEHPHPFASCLRYLHRTHRRREIRPRGHPIPQLVEVPLEVLLELCDRLLVDTRGPLVGLDLLVGLPDNPLGNRKRLGLSASIRSPAPPTHRAVDHQTNPDDPPPSLQPHYRAFTATTSRSAPAPRIGTLPLAVSAAWGPPSRAGTDGPHTADGVGATGSHVPHQSLSRARAAFMPDTAWAVSRSPPGSSRGNDSPPVSMSSLRFRHVIGGSLSLAFSAHT